jgi:hypothetical protein
MNAPIKLKTKDLKSTRLQLLESQGFVCAICSLPCTEDQAVLDHNHAIGHVRAVLHRGCNAAEGKVINTLRRYGIKDTDTFLLGLLQYHKDHADNQTGLVHPAFKTPEEKLQARKVRAKKARLKAKLQK